MINITFMFITLTLTIANSQDIPDVKIYIESLCSDTLKSMKMISDQTIESLDQIAKVEFIPSGKKNPKGHHEPNTYITNCQNNEKECYGNMILACGLNLQKNQVESTKFVRCFFKEQSGEEFFDKEIDKCIGSVQQKLQVKACANGPQGIELLYRNRMKTPDLSFVPSIAINGQIDKLKEDFGKLICSKMNSSVCKGLKWD
ncbi:unnamed protein product [Paramecium sonneborni]|uniref:Uncharacterized protein n=1 Tax=Paramecium sonneborni TaxID=65129 RepID=A0A8S1N741_9CILI|nr:unnamed protein product [Paramecium sonneborni]